MTEEDGNQFTVAKVRGLTLNYEASKIINFDTIKEFILNPPTEPLLVSYKNKIQRKRPYMVVSKSLTKKYNKVAPKRRLIDDIHFKTLPFGYVD